MRTLFALSLLLLACPNLTASQWTPACDTSRPEDYIPVDLEDSLVQLYCTLNPQVVREMKSGTEDAMARYHHGLGTGLRNTWGLWAGSRLSRHLNGLGLKHPDDMSAVILSSFWRRLHGEPLRVEERVRYYQAYWEAHFEPPAIRCPTGEEGSWTMSSKDGELPNSFIVTYYAECPGDGWFQYTKGADGWSWIGRRPPIESEDLIERE